MIVPCLRDDGQHARRAATGDQLLHSAPCQHAVRLLNAAGGCEHAVSFAMLRQAPQEQLHAQCCRRRRRAAY